MAAQAKPKSVIPAKATRKGQIPLLTRLKARNLYLTQGLPYKAISAETGLPEETLQQLAHREGWTEQRRQTKRRLMKNADARMEAQQSEAMEAIAALSEQHVVKSMERIGEALERTDQFAARDFQSFTGGARNLVSIMKEIRQPEQQSVDGSRGLSVFVVRVGEAAQPKQERNVTANTAAALALSSAAVDTVAIDLPKA